jgi:hypothetical protein
VQILEVCPRVPVLELTVESDVLEHSFRDRMQLFLSGSLETQISYELPLKPASPTPPKLNAN